MEIKDLKHAEELLINMTQNNDIKIYIENRTDTWNFEDSDLINDITEKINKLFFELYHEIIQDHNDSNLEVLQCIVFNNINDWLMPCIRKKFYNEDLDFFEKCILFCDMKISAEHFGADENYTIPLSAAVVELSVIDNYKSPTEKMNCLCSTYDLVFAEIKSALVSLISKSSEKENEIPIIDNSDVIPVLMAVIVRSKLTHLFSNLFYIKTFYHKIEEKHIIVDILKSFENAVNKLSALDIDAIQSRPGKIIQSICPEEFIKITCNTEDEVITNKTLADEANQRILNLITKATDEDQSY